MVKYKFHQQKFFDGKESSWDEEEYEEELWSIEEHNMPEWLRKNI